MSKILKRNGRRFDQLRSLSITRNPFGKTHNSLLFELGDTKILCSVTLQKGVPHFLRGTKSGWLTAEYALLPTATSTRSPRESSLLYKNGRSVEISRLIGRSLRSTVNLALLGERTIIVDCDVLNADGGTRTACVTAASLLLQLVVSRWLAEGILKDSIVVTHLCAISVGIVGSEVLLDVNYEEDSSVDADYNFILSSGGDIIEIQGSSEKEPISWKLFEKAKDLAIKGTKELFELCERFVYSDQQQSKVEKISNVSLFSLKNRHIPDSIR